MPVQRAAAWADAHLLRGALVVLVLTDACIGANWFLSPSLALSSPAYATAKAIMPMHGYGLVLLVLSALASASLLHEFRSPLSGYLVGFALGGVCAFWSVLFLLAGFSQHTTSFLGASVFTCLTLMHLLTGVASSYTSGPTYR